MKKLIKSYSFWTSLAGALGILIVSVGKFCGVNIEATGVEEIVMGICGVLVAVGIVTKPKNIKTPESDVTIKDESDSKINEEQGEQPEKKEK